MNSRSSGVANDDRSSASSFTSRTSKRSMEISVITRGMNVARKGKWNIKFNAEVLDPFKGQLKYRLDHSNAKHMQSKVENPKHKCCQLCHWGKGRRHTRTYCVVRHVMLMFALIVMTHFIMKSQLLQRRENYFRASSKILTKYEL